jgi:hypothetical protein
LRHHLIRLKVPNAGVVVAENGTQSRTVQLAYVEVGFFHVVSPTLLTLGIHLLHFPDDKHAILHFELASIALVGVWDQTAVDTIPI